MNWDGLAQKWKPEKDIDNFNINGLRLQYALIDNNIQLYAIRNDYEDENLKIKATNKISTNKEFETKSDYTVISVKSITPFVNDDNKLKFNADGQIFRRSKIINAADRQAINFMSGNDGKSISFKSKKWWFLSYS